MDPAIEDLISLINFELDPTFVIRYIQSGVEYYLKDMDFVITQDSLIRTRNWTDTTATALRFHDFDEISNFIKHQMIDTDVSIKEIM